MFLLIFQHVYNKYVNLHYHNDPHELKQVRIYLIDFKQCFLKLGFD